MTDYIQFFTILVNDDLAIESSSVVYIFYKGIVS